MDDKDKIMVMSVANDVAKDVKTLDRMIFKYGLVDSCSDILRKATEASGEPVPAEVETILAHHKRLVGLLTDAREQLMNLFDTSFMPAAEAKKDEDKDEEEYRIIR